MVGALAGVGRHTSVLEGARAENLPEEVGPATSWFEFHHHGRFADVRPLRATYGRLDFLHSRSLLRALSKFLPADRMPALDELVDLLPRRPELVILVG